MREKMIYNPGIYQLRGKALQRMLEIIELQKHSLENQIVFFGDSILEFYDVKKYFPDDTIYNCGIAGATSGELLWIIDEAVLKFKPSKVFIHVGTNDLGNTVMHSPREIAQNIQMITKIIQKNLPECEIYVLSPLPCIEEKQDYYHTKGIRCNHFLKDIYALFDEYLENVHLINVYDDFVDNDKLYKDGLHPNDDGYDLLTKSIRKYLRV